MFGILVSFLRLGGWFRRRLGRSVAFGPGSASAAGFVRADIAGGGERPRPAKTAQAHSAGLNPAVTVAGASEAAVGGEHGAGDRDREHRAEALRHVVDPGRLAHLLRGDGAQDGGRHRREGHRDADAGDEERDRRARSSSCPASRARRPRRTRPSAASGPTTMIGRRPIRSDSAPASGETTIGVAKNGSRRSPAPSRRVVRGRAGTPAVTKSAGGEDGAGHEERRQRCRSRTSRSANSAQRHHRLGGAALPPEERDKQRGARR